VVIYAESSAVLSWLFDEPRAADVMNAIESAELVVMSDLAAVECARAILRALQRERIDQAQANALYAAFISAASQWDRLEIGERVISLASGPFPAEPIRALDALHLASAVLVRDEWPDMAVLSFDERVRANAAALGLNVFQDAN
jgi:predicted nucleic acid-binding protein